MVTDVVRSPNSVLLAVGAAGTDPAGWVGRGLAQEVDSKEARTVGVVTKVDQIFGPVDTQLSLDNRQQLKETIDNSQKVHYYAAYNLKKQDQDAFAEQNYDLQGEIARCFDPDRVGNAAITRDLEVKLHRHIHKQLPALYTTFRTKKADLDKELHTVSDPSWRTVEQIFLTYCQIVERTLDGGTHEAMVGTSQVGSRGFKKALEQKVGDFKLQMSPQVIYRDQASRETIICMSTQVGFPLFFCDFQ